MAMVNLSAPWIIFYREVEALFRLDPDVHVLYDDSTHELRLYVEDSIKADALEKILPTKKEFGNVTVNIIVMVGNTACQFTEYDDVSPFEIAFADNPALSFVRVVQDIFGQDITYVVFAPEVVHFWTDDLGDMYGMKHTLYQDIARDVFKGMSGVYYSTDVKDADLPKSTEPELWP